MAIFSVSGLSSGINYNDMISKILEVERQPIYRLQKKQSTYNEKINVYSDLSTKLSALKSAAENLKSVANFYIKKASTSDSTIFDATAASSAATGNYSISITQLAQAHRIASSGVASETSTISTVSGNFSFKVGSGTTTTISVTTSTTLKDLRDAINTANGDVEASIINDGSASPYKLVLTSKSSGSSNSITITENVTTLGFPTGPVVGGTTLQAAQNASLTIDGLSITKSSNTVTDAISGVTVTLKKTGSGTLSVTNDIDGIKKRVEDFVNAYNDVISTVSTKALYDTSTRTGGPLTGEATPREIVNKLRSIIGSRVSGLPEDMRVLSQIGITTGSDGKLSINSTKLNDKLTTNLTGVSNLFNATGGVAVQVWDYTDTVTDSIDGAVTLRKKGLGTLVDNIADDIIKLKDRLDKREEALSRQFASLESLLGGLISQGAFLSNQITIWGKK